MMDRDMAGRQLDDLPSGDSMDIDKDTLGMLFPPGETAGVIDPRTRSAATKFAQDHNCRFLFDDQSSKSTFLKLPGRWYELIENVCTGLGRETPGTESFRINLDYKISEAEARASQSEAIPIVKHRSSVSKNFKRRCAKFYTWVRTAILRIKKFGLRPCICSITLAFAPQATNHLSDSAARAKQRHGLMPRRPGSAGMRLLQANLIRQRPVR
jgi:hypothetical protein